LSIRPTIEIDQKNKIMANRFALIIANSRYEHPKIRDLFKTGADAGGMRRVLMEVCSFPEAHVTLLEDKPSHEARVEIAKFFKNRRPDDLLILYFAGHGMRGSDGHLCLTFTDTDPEYCEDTSIEARNISRHMDSSRSKRQLVMLDCCYSGAFAHGAREVVGSTMDTEESFRGAMDGKGRFVITSSDKQQISLEESDQDDTKDFAVFTRYVIEGLRSGKAAEARGDITVGSLVRLCLRAGHDGHRGQTDA
jgi:uncharacterized caspase-like protein